MIHSSADKEDAMANIDDLIEIKEFPIPTTYRGDTGRCLDWTSGRNARPAFGGVYVFWWQPGPAQFYNALQNRTFHYAGPAGQPLAWTLTEADLRSVKNGCIPLYIGKNASDIANRVGLHLCLGTARTVPADAVNGVAPRRRPSCQIRDRFDRLFPCLEDTRQFLLENLALSYVRVDNFVERFFLEDLAVGSFGPVFNVDSER